MKILIAGVGGQGIVYLTNIIVEAAMQMDIPVSVSEIHGLSQRGGVVTSGIGLGEYCTGFIGKANVDFLIGLEPLEAQRCLSYLHKNSQVVFGSYRVQPYSVNAQIAEYPDVALFEKYLEGDCKEVVCIDKFPESIDAVLYNIFMLGVATKMTGFPFNSDCIKSAIEATVTGYYRDKTNNAFNLGLGYELKQQKRA